MITTIAFFSSIASRCKHDGARLRQLILQLLRDEGGSYILYMTLAFMPVLVGAAGLGSEAVRWLHIHQTLQNAADSAAVSAALALESNRNNPNQTQIATTQAIAVAALYCGTQGVSKTCFVDGQNDTTVDVGFPGFVAMDPASYQATVTVTQQQTKIVSVSLHWLSNPVTISATASARLNQNTGNCLLSLANSGVGISDTKNTQAISLTNCSIFSNSNAPNALNVQGNDDAWTAKYIGTAGQAAGNGYSPTPIQGAPAVSDPYAAEAENWPSVCTGSSCGPVNPNCNPCPANATLLPGTYSQGITLNQAGTYKLNPGVYYVNGINIGDNITVNAPCAALPCSGGVTLVLTGTSSIVVGNNTNNTTINIQAPTTGWNAGIAIWEPLSNGNNHLAGNGFIANVTGAIYAPNANIAYSGNSNPQNATCTQIVAQRITFTNSTSLQGGDNCVGVPGAPTLLFGRRALLVQ
jgi:Flp pilus assembly protein TadG